MPRTGRPRIHVTLKEARRVAAERYRKRNRAKYLQHARNWREKNPELHRGRVRQSSKKLPQLSKMQRVEMKAAQVLALQNVAESPSAKPRAKIF